MATLEIRASHGFPNWGKILSKDLWNMWAPKEISFQIGVTSWKKIMTKANRSTQHKSTMKENASIREIWKAKSQNTKQTTKYVQKTSLIVQYWQYYIDFGSSPTSEQPTFTIKMTKIPP